jgi:alpha-1,3-rhamnosyl/mannosyltransferase
VWTRGVLTELSRANPDWTIDVALFKGEQVDLAGIGFGPNARTKPINIARSLHTRLLVTRLIPTIERYTGAYDVMLGPAFATWPAKRAAEVPVIHDLTFRKHPGFVSRRNLVFLRSLIGRIARRASVIVTVSEAMKGEIAQELNVTADRIAVVPNGVDAGAFADPGPLPEGTPDRYLLFVGTLEPRKNLSNVLAAYALLRHLVEAPPALVVVGGRGWRESGMPEAHELPEGVHQLGYVEHSQLASIYANAEALVFPSLYEGFGLPVIEAMTAGTAVITSRRGGLPEVGADAVLYVDPEDPESISAGMKELLEDEALRNDLVAKGIERARTFTWSASADALKAALDEAVERSRAKRSN